MNVKKELENSLKEAMKAKDEVKRSAIRMALTSIKLAEVEAREGLEDTQEYKILQKEIKIKEETISEAKKAGREDMIGPIAREIELLKEFLPKEFSDEELNQLVREVTEEMDSESIKDMGKVMKIAIIKARGRASNDRISKTVRNFLTES